MMLKRTTATPALLIILLITFLSPTALQGQQRRRITESVDSRRTVLLPGTTHARIRQALDRGRVAADLAMERGILALKSSPEQEADLEVLLAAQQDPSSPLYHQWLTPKEFGERFGVPAEDLSILRQWLETYGLHVDQVADGRREIEFSGTARQIERAFSTEIHWYDSNGEMHVANATDISIPQALAGTVLGVVSLHDFVSKPKLQRFRSEPNFTFGGRHAMVPYDFAVIYDLAPLWNQGFDGTGQTIAIVGRTNINIDDVATYRSMYGLPAANLEVIVNGSDPGIVSADEEGEADLDVEWSGAVAKGAKIRLIVSPNTRATDGVVLSEMYIVNNNAAPVMSSSFGFCETSSPSTSRFYANLWQQAAAQGISVVVSSGDSGSAGCDSASSAGGARRGLSVNGEASTPYNVAVGGTQFNENGADSVYWNATNNPQNRSSVKIYIPEVVWNESGPDGLWSSGGGVSTVHGTPSWQTGYGVPTVDPGTTDQHHRYVPDVSLTAAGHDGYVIQQRSSLFIASGTSASAPAFAGILAIVNQLTNQANGNPNPRLYALASQVPTVFHDITSGTNVVPCAAGTPNCVDGFMPGYSAGPGYDLATGLGSIDAYVFVHAWQTSTAPPPPDTGPPSPPPPPAPNASLTASTYHVFPVIADGRVSDGSYFRSTLMISNPNTSVTTCTLQLRGLTVPGLALTYSLQPNGFVIAPTSATQSIKAGYATLQCTPASVEAQLLYSYYSSNGTKLAEAAVFSSPSASKVQILADTREGAQIGIALANDSDAQNTYTIAVDDGSGTVAATASRTLPPRTSIAQYLSQMVTLPPNYVGRVTVSSTTGTSSIIGLRYTGNLFATIPQTIQP